MKMLLNPRSGSTACLGENLYVLCTVNMSVTNHKVQQEDNNDVLAWCQGNLVSQLVIKAT